MEFFLFVISLVHAAYYGILILFTDTPLGTRLFWPVSALFCFLLFLLLSYDSKRTQRHHRFLPRDLRTVIEVSVGIAVFLAAFMALWMLLLNIRTEVTSCDYLILAENDNQKVDLSTEDHRALERTARFLEKNPQATVVLAGSSRFQNEEVDEQKIQDLMAAYLSEKGIAKSRIITEKISNNIKQNIIYSYAYIFVDWYGNREASNEEDPVVAVVTDSISLLRYQMIIKETGRNAKILTYSDDLTVIPARFIEELQLLLYYHLNAAFAK